MKRMPETCKKCSASVVEHYPFEDETEDTAMVCSIMNKCCPVERKPNGCDGYTMPEWCPLMDIYFPEEED